MADGVEYVSEQHLDNRCRSAEHNISSRDMFIAAPTSILRRVIAVPTSIPPAYPPCTEIRPAEKSSQLSQLQHGGAQEGRPTQTPTRDIFCMQAALRKLAFDGSAPLRKLVLGEPEPFISRLDISGFHIAHHIVVYLASRCVWFESMKFQFYSMIFSLLGNNCMV
jgi:hypothetical protein